MSRRCYILVEADHEIDAQVAYYADHSGARLAERFYQDLQATLRSLLKSPGKGRIFVSSNKALVGIRSWLMSGFPFLIYYREVDDGIEIVHVLHGARDRDNILG